MFPPPGIVSHEAMTLYANSSHQAWHDSVFYIKIITTADWHYILKQINHNVNNPQPHLLKVHKNLKIWKGKHIKFIVRQLLLLHDYSLTSLELSLSKGQYFKNNEIAKIYNNGTMDAILILTIFCGCNRMGCLNILT